MIGTWFLLTMYSTMSLRLAAARGKSFVPLLLGQELEEGVQALVHPGPLALVGVDDHREVVVARPRG